MAENRIVFFSREAIVHHLGGSTTAAMNLLQVLASHPSRITLFVTCAYGRSPRLFFKRRVPLPSSVEFAAPGYIRIGDWYLLPFSLKAWSRALCRAAARWPFLRPIGAALVSAFGGGLVPEAWDLTTPTAQEIEAAMRHIAKHDPGIVLVNYAFWGPLLGSPELAGRKRVVLMHDMLSARVAKFLASGLPLDCPFISAETEISWLNQADYILAAQKEEAMSIAPQVRADVLVQPIILSTHEDSRPPDPFVCSFVGSQIQPNINGIHWFLNQVWPRVLAGNPRAELRIAGSVCRRVEGVHRNVRLLGIVPSLEAEILRAGVSLVPLQVGSGVKIKLLEALSYGRACVATPIGVQGLEDWAEGAIEVAEDAAGFSNAVLRLMFDDRLREQREEASLELIRKHFSAESAPAREFAARVLGGGAASAPLHAASSKASSAAD